jgi:hypothetical protein
MALSHLMDASLLVAQDTLLELSRIVEPAWALEQAQVDDILSLQCAIERKFVTSTSPEAQTLDAFRASATPPTIEAYGRFIDGLVREFFAKNQFVSAAVQLSVRITMERIVLAPVFCTLFEKCVRDCFEAENELREKLDVHLAKGFAESCAVLGVPERLRFHWRGATSALGAWAALDASPTSLLQVILRVKEEIFLEAADRGLKPMSADDLLPVFALIVLDAKKVHNLCAVCFFLRLFFGDELQTGEPAYYIVSLESALQQLKRSV